MNALLLSIHLVEPLLVTQPQTGEENSSSSYEHIPGSQLRGAVIQRYLLENGLEPESWAPEQDALGCNFFNGGLKFLNAYPAHPQTGIRSLPRPFSWLEKKGGEKPRIVYDYAVQDPKFTVAMKAAREKFFWLSSSSLALYSPELLVTVHNASLDRNRKRAGDSFVYRYEALPAGENYLAPILSNDLALLQKIHGWLDGKSLLLGGSHTAGYGRVEIKCQIDPNWQESLEDPNAPAQMVTVMLLSDLIGRTNDGQVSANFYRLLAEALGMTGSIEHKKAFQQVRLVGGFNRKWGLPLPQAWALSSGSVFQFCAQDLDLGRLRQLSLEGLGERRNEGFGRIGINLTSLDVFHPLASVPVATTTAVHPPLSGESRSLAKRMASQRLRLHLDRMLVKAINQVQFETHVPEKTQLSRLRVASQQALVKRDLAGIQEHLQNLKASKKQFERCRVKAENRKIRLINWIEDRLEMKNFEVIFMLNSLPSVAGIQAEVETELKVEYTARLLDGVMRKAVKKQQQGEETR